MNTKILTGPSPELKQHVNELRLDAAHIVQDVKNQVTTGVREVQSEANTRFDQARTSVLSLINLFKGFAGENVLTLFAMGVITSMVLAAWRNGKRFYSLHRSKNQPQENYV